jgi:hypothetical protein
MVSFEGVSLIRRVHNLHPRQARQLDVSDSKETPDIAETAAWV